jgi:hypothetical protein
MFSEGKQIAPTGSPDRLPDPANTQRFRWFNPLFPRRLRHD